MKRFIFYIICIFVIVCSCVFLSFASMDTVTINVPWSRPVQPYIDIVEQKSNGVIVVTEYVVAVPIDYGAGTNFVTASIDSEHLEIIASTGRSDYSGSWGSWRQNRYVNLPDDTYYTLSYTQHTSIATGTASSNRYTWVNRNFPFTSTGTLIGFEYGGGMTCVTSSSTRSNVSIVYAGEVSSNWELQVLNALKGTENTSALILAAVNQCRAQLVSSNQKFDSMIDIMEGEPIAEFVPETNPDVSELDDAEGALLDDSFSQLGDFEPEPFNPSQGQLGSAFQWFKNELEFSTSNSKLRSSILVILSLSVVAFLFNIFV